MITKRNRIAVPSSEQIMSYIRKMFPFKGKDVLFKDLCEGVVSYIKGNLSCLRERCPFQGKDVLLKDLCKGNVSCVKEMCPFLRERCPFERLV